ncbi:site-specific DNA-methyltransferase [Cupriavidus sp. SW-Y-13]|uniref:DNA-methyltransferase n=1 Tax=Cupriavidus sp. SW-Y-13 TaxID=2653854 RepID=UPI001366017A|nr:site-specific DNA-methyltransferase [Cupriavidus sp. SW-Y-13]MWL87140.1 site-specific DNA-methyltransferase [Cupriavidus sp. SW-Y-13]
MKPVIPAKLLNRLHRKDALEVLRSLPDRSVDLYFTDPPYSSGGLHASTRAQSPGQKYIGSDVKTLYPEFHHDNKDQRSWTFWCMSWLGEAYRAAKDGGHLVCFTDWRQLPSLTDAVQAAGFIWRGIAVWDKMSGGARPRLGGFSQQAEFMVWATKGAVRTDQKVHLPGVFSERLPRPKVHMSQKPAGLAQEVIQLVPAGSVMCDPFAGSGTFLLAAKERGLWWIGCEIEETYHAKATERLSAA